MWSRAQRNDAPRDTLVQNHEIVGRLNKVERRGNVHRSRNTGWEAVRRWIVIAPFFPVSILPLLQGPWLQRKGQVGRIDNHSSAALSEPIDLVFFQSEICAARV